MKTINTISLILGLFACSGVCYLLFGANQEKTAFFMNAEVYNDFAYKLELEKELQKEEQFIKQSIDSLENELQITIAYLESIEPTEDQLEALQRKRQYYVKYKAQQEQTYSEKAQDYYTKIWDRINEHVKLYGQENGYRYIFGANGDGSLMYGSESENISEKLLEFINGKYNGE